MVWSIYSNVRAHSPQAVASIQHSAAGQQCRSLDDGSANDLPGSEHQRIWPDGRH
ncbi:hypothetical protein [Paenibacillus polymyxa]|uniref:hypothetical protein n=1 Tax=Paenibacillus polymyxa TaxID=1406 RepID=UPI00287FEDE0|nr:hypothetical protein [Paenibacillus polymyxa]